MKNIYECQPAGLCNTTEREGRGGHGSDLWNLVIENVLEKTGPMTDS